MIRNAYFDLFYLLDKRKKIERTVPVLVNAMLGILTAETYAWCSTDWMFTPGQFKKTPLRSYFASDKYNGVLLVQSSGAV